MDLIQSIIMEFNLIEHVYKEINLDAIDLNAVNNSKIYWVHCNLSQQNEFEKIIKKLEIPNDVIALCNKVDTTPKFFDQGHYLTMRIQCLLSNEIGKHYTARLSNLVIHLTSHYCFTASYDTIPALNTFIQSYSRAMQYAKTPCFILFLLLDNVINDYSSILYDLEIAADKMDFRIHASHHHSFNKVTHTRKQVMKIKRYAIAIRDILMRISGRKIAVISETCRLSLSNLFDHSLMIVSQTDAIRDVLNSMLEQIDNSLMFKMSESMKILTIFAAILLPMTLIAGIYGMNFHWMPELQWKYGYFYALSLMIFVAVVLLSIFKFKKWF